MAPPQAEVVGCIQFSSPAWRMRARDEWIGWIEERRKVALQQVVNNSRFLVLVPIRNLASMILSCTLRELKVDWKRQDGLKPLLVETLVDRQQSTDQGREYYDGIVNFLYSKEIHSMKLSGLEQELEKRGRELMRILLQEHLNKLSKSAAVFII